MNANDHPIVARLKEFGLFPNLHRSKLKAGKKVVEGAIELAKLKCRHCGGIGHKTGVCKIRERLYDLAGRDHVTKSWVNQGLDGIVLQGGMFHGVNIRRPPDDRGLQGIRARIGHKRRRVNGNGADVDDEEYGP